METTRLPELKNGDIANKARVGSGKGTPKSLSRPASNPSLPIVPGAAKTSTNDGASTPKRASRVSSPLTSSRTALSNTNANANTSQPSPSPSPSPQPPVQNILPKGGPPSSHSDESSSKPKRQSVRQLAKHALHVIAEKNGESTPRTSFRLEDFEIKNTLGTGSFGRVHLVKLKATGKYFAMKVLRKSDIVKMKQVEHTINEKNILEQLEMPFLVGMLGTFQDANHVFLVLEYIQGGELFTFLRKSGMFPNHVAKFYAAEVVLAFEYLHKADIIYRDLKPENILIDADGHIRITDFGFAKSVPDQTWTLCGTPDYLAPEIIQSKGYGRAVDWWAVGVLIYEVCTLLIFFLEFI
jgi:tRNA A-37 threonylcarbamoyl transferase component Bud32